MFALSEDCPVCLFLWTLAVYILWLYFWGCISKLVYHWTQWLFWGFLWYYSSLEWWLRSCKIEYKLFWNKNQDNGIQYVGIWSQFERATPATSPNMQGRLVTVHWKNVRSIWLISLHIAVFMSIEYKIFDRVFIYFARLNLKKVCITGMRWITGFWIRWVEDEHRFIAILVAFVPHCLYCNYQAELNMGIGLRVYTGPDTPAWVYAEGVFYNFWSPWSWLPEKTKVPEIRLNCSNPNEHSHDCWDDASFPYYPDPLYQVSSWLHQLKARSFFLLLFQELYFGFIREFHNHLETLPSIIRDNILFIQVTFYVE